MWISKNKPMMWFSDIIHFSVIRCYGLNLTAHRKGLWKPNKGVPEELCPCGLFFSSVQSVSLLLTKPTVVVCCVRLCIKEPKKVCSCGQMCLCAHSSVSTCGCSGITVNRSLSLRGNTTVFHPCLGDVTSDFNASSDAQWIATAPPSGNHCATTSSWSLTTGPFAKVVIRPWWEWANKQGRGVLRWFSSDRSGGNSSAIMLYQVCRGNKPFCYSLFWIILILDLPCLLFQQ